MAGWSIIASGLAKGAEVIEALTQGLENLKVLPGAQNVTTDVTATKEGWTLAASGEGDSPNDHALVLSHVTGLIANPALETGTSEINGPFVAAQNFHTAPAAGYTVPTAPDPGAATPAG